MTTSHPTDSAVTLPRSAALPGAATAAPGASPPLPHLRGGGEAQASADRMSEAQLERQVRAILKDIAALAPAGDVLGYHTYFSKASHAGFPDWVFAGPRGVIFRELKTAKGRLSIAQVMWRRALREGGADVDVWRPADLLSGRVARELAALAGIGAA